MNVDEIFIRFVKAMILIMLLYGAGMTLVIILGEETIGLRMVNGFSSMFVAVLGFGSGYILGRKINGNGKEAPHDDP